MAFAPGRTGGRRGQAGNAPRSTAPVTVSSPRMADSTAGAAWRRRYVELEDQHKALERQHARMSRKCDDMSKELRRLRSLTEHQSREMHSLRSASQRILAEKEGAEKRARVNKQYAQKMEHKIASGARGQFLAEHSNQLQRDLIAAHHEIARRDNLIASQDKRLRDANREVSVLTRALEARATELGLDGSRDVRKGLLYESARCKEELKRLHAELEARTERARNVAKALGECQAALRGCEEREAQLLRQVQSLTEERDAALTEVRTAKETIDTMESQRGELLDYVQHQSEELSSATHRASTAEAAIAHTQEAGEKEAANLRRLLGEAKAHAQELETTLTKQRRVQEVTEQALGSQRVKSGAAVKRMEEAERKVADAHAAATRANAEVERFKAERAQLEDRIAQLESRQDSLASQLAEAEQELTSTKDTLQAERDAKASAERDHATAVAALEKDLQDAIAARQHSTTTMGHATQEAAVLSADKEMLSKKCAKLEAQVTNLKSAKALLQRTMLSQLASVREQLRIEQAKRAQVEHDAGPVIQENQRLMALYSAASARLGDPQPVAAPRPPATSPATALPPPAPVTVASTGTRGSDGDVGSSVASPPAPASAGVSAASARAKALAAQLVQRRLASSYLTSSGSPR